MFKLILIATTITGSSLEMKVADGFSTYELCQKVGLIKAQMVETAINSVDVIVDSRCENEQR